MERQVLAEKHNLKQELLFRLKSTILRWKRRFKNLFSPPPKFVIKNTSSKTFLLAVSESDLWNKHDNPDNWILTAGKVENLRIASRRLNGLEVKANQIFSFWRHIGNPNMGKGYKIGREIREGCIVPTKAGGLCQLSNALYDAALKAGFTIIERHKHTKVIPGSLAEQDRDATVKWNYVDLRFKASQDFRMDIELTADKLQVIFKSTGKNDTQTVQDQQPRQSHKLNDCYSCGNVSCFKHPDRSGHSREVAHKAFVLDEKWPEFESYVQREATAEDTLVLPLRKNFLFRTNRYDWKGVRATQRYVTFWGIYRALKLRLRAGRKNVFATGLSLDRVLAREMVKSIPVSATHIVVSQNLLPFLFEYGALGGRTFEVLMTRLPTELLHQRLDQAHQLYAESPTLKDFRAPQDFIDLENKALTRATKIISPHAEILALFKHKSYPLAWYFPSVKKDIKTGTKILFPASALGRKGAYEMRSLAADLGISLVVAGQALESEGFWEGVKIEPFGGNWSDIAIVVYPPYIEHQPRVLLRALAYGIPVLASEACGLGQVNGLHILPIGDYQALKQAVEERMPTGMLIK